MLNDQWQTLKTIEVFPLLIKHNCEDYIWIRHIKSEPVIVHIFDNQMIENKNRVILEPQITENDSYRYVKSVFEYSHYTHRYSVYSNCISKKIRVSTYEFALSDGTPLPRINIGVTERVEIPKGFYICEYPITPRYFESVTPNFIVREDDLWDFLNIKYEPIEEIKQSIPIAADWLEERLFHETDNKYDILMAKHASITLRQYSNLLIESN